MNPKLEILDTREEAVARAKEKTLLQAAPFAGKKCRVEDPENSFVIYSGDYYKDYKGRWLELISVNLFRKIGVEGENLYVSTTAILKG